MTQKKRTVTQSSNTVRKSLAMLTAAAAVGATPSLAMAEGPHSDIADWGTWGGVGVHWSWGSGWDWGFEAFFDLLSADPFTPGPYAGASLLVDFMESPTEGTQVSFALHGGYGQYAIASAQAEVGFGYRSGRYRSKDELAWADFVGVKAHHFTLTSAARGSFARGEAVYQLGLNSNTAVGAVLGLAIGSLTTVDGRPLRAEEGMAPLPDINIDHWLQEIDVLDSREQIVAMWARRAQQEWASIPAFAQLIQQLRAVGAPEVFSRRAARAAEQEMQHAVLTAGMTAKVWGSGVSLAPADVNTRAPAQGREGLKRLAVESWLDGCLGEGFAALGAAKEAEVTSDPHALSTLHQIARDEQGHAELAWDILAWSMAQGDDVVDAVRAVRDAVPVQERGATIPPQWWVDAVAQSRARLDTLIAAA